MDRQHEALREREAVPGAEIHVGEMAAALTATQVTLYATEESLLRHLAGEYSLGPVPSDRYVLVSL